MRKLIVPALLLITALLAAPPSAVRSQEEDASPRVELLDAGSEPRIPLRYKFQAGREETMVLDMKTSMHLSMQGVAQPAMDLPGMRMVMKLSNSEFTEEGDFRYSFEVTGASVLEGGDPNMAESLNAGLAAALGMKGWAVIDARGIVQDGDVELPPDADPQALQAIEGMKQSMARMSAPLPEEPVGPGASWKVTMSVAANGITIDQVATYRLISLSRDVAELELNIVQSGEEQIMALPNLPPGVIAELQSLDSKGAGWTTLDLTKMVPTASFDLKMNMSALLTMEGQQMPMTTKAETSVKISPRAVTESVEVEEDK